VHVQLHKGAATDAVAWLGILVSDTRTLNDVAGRQRAEIGQFDAQSGPVEALDCVAETRGIHGRHNDRGLSRRPAARTHGGDNENVDTAHLRERIQAFIDQHDLIAPGGEVTCLVSGGADSTCLWHALRQLGYGVSALHVNHGLRGGESDEDARFCADRLGAEVVDGRGGTTEDELRRIRYSFAPDRLRATGHTATDQVETLIYRLAASGKTGGIKPRREDGVVRPLLTVWREETEAYCRAEGLEFRPDPTNRHTKRGLIRDEILPRLRELHPAALDNLLRAAEAERWSPLDELLAATSGSRRLDLGGGLTAVREYEQVWLERTPVALEGEVRWGDWRIASDLPGLKVRAWRAGDRLAGRSKKIQDVFVDAKIPRSARETWPLVVRGDEVVAVPGVVEAEGVTAERVSS
jgi:tRNA(Ile)-lysidine synthetase-like protein